jgi:branched-subunit amino acid ABC-type transport system permease component
MELAATTVTNALVLSSMYILVALGFAFLLSIMGILNFAHGAIYMIGGYICYQFAVEYGLNQWVSLLLSVIIVGAFGLFLEKFFFRPFFGNMNRTIVVTIAIILILETGVNVTVGAYVRALPSFMPGLLKAGAISLSAERLVTFVIGGALLAFMIWFIRNMKQGQQMQAVSQDLEGATLQGISVHRVSALACAMACGLAAVAGSLMGAIFNLSPVMGDYMLVKALQLVILSGIGSIGGILFAGLIIGGLDATLPLFLGGDASQAIALGIIVVLLLFRPQGFFGRAMVEERHADVVKERISTRGLGKLTQPAVYGGLIVIIALFPLFIKSPYLLHIFILTLIYIVAASSLRLITVSGQFPLAHGAFMGIGAYTSAVVAIELGWSPWLTIPLGGLMAMGIGMLIGYPFARLRTLYYAMVSLFFGIGMIYVIDVFEKWTHGYAGLTNIPSLFPTTTSIVPYFYFFLGLTAICLLALHRFEFSRIGTSLKAIDQSYMVASSVGINEAGYRVLALGVGGFFVGIAGAAYAHYNITITPASFNLTATLWLFMYALIGGIGSFAGPIIGTALLIIAPELFRGLKEFVPFISAAILLIVVFVMPQGLVSLPQLARSWFIGRREKKGITHTS